MSQSTPIDEFAQPASDARLARAAQYLAALRSAGARPKSLPADLAPADQAQAYALQRATAHRLGARVAGWKVSMSDATTGLSAPVFAADLAPSPAVVNSAISGQFGIEPEIAFTLSHDLAPLPAHQAYSRGQLIEAIGSAHAAIEVVISRFERHDQALPLDVLADNVSNGGLVVGAAVRDWQALALAALPLRLTLSSADGAQELIELIGGHPLNDPLLPLVWLANHCSQRALTLRAGSVVTTGSCAGLRYVGVGAKVRASFEGLGAAELVTV